MSAATPSGPTVPKPVAALAAVVQRAADAVDSLYEAGHLDAAEDLDAILSEAEQLLEDIGDYEDGADLENDLLSEVDEDGAHEFATELPECEVHDDDLDFAYERGRYAPERRARFNDDTDGDLDFTYAPAGAP